jgi:hypothetical protein
MQFHVTIEAYDEDIICFGSDCRDRVTDKI